MSADDWYRRTTWTAQDQQEFFARLNRSRTSYNKAQYLRIQAYYLQNINTQASLELLDNMITNWPEPSELPQAYLQTAECLIKLKDTNGAIEAFRNSFKSEKSKVSTQAYLKFGLFVIENSLTSLFEESLTMLELGESITIFPKNIYEYYGIKAIIFDYHNKHEEAKESALKAIEAAQKTESGFRYHKDIGLVRDFSSIFHEKIARIAQIN